jgi:hypothetical protein
MNHHVKIPLSHFRALRPGAGTILPWSRSFSTRACAFWSSTQCNIAQIIASVRSNEVGHYSLPEYSNVLSLIERGTKSFSSFNITGWENELMNSNIDYIISNTAVS